MIRNRKWIIPLIILMILSGCTQKERESKMESYYQISQEEAKQMMKKDDGHIIVDVRRQDEYDEGHIPGAILLPNESITDKQPEQLPDKDQIVLIYCRSGNRSKQAAEKLFDMGYTKIYEFGGILDWTGEVVKEEDSYVLLIEANGNKLLAKLADNSSARDLMEKLKDETIELELHDYGDFEKVGPLPWSLERNDESITTKPGDVILYQGNQITIYYDENNWTFTRLGEIEDVSRQDLLDVLGNGHVKIRLSLQKGE